MNRKLQTHELARKSITEFVNTTKMPFVIVLDNIRSANNVGSIFRTADAFAAEAIYLCGITACPPNREINKTALGSALSVTWHHYPSTNQAVQLLKDEGYLIYSVEQTDSKIYLDEFNPEADKKYAFIFGNEVTGVDQDIINQSNACIEIKQMGTKHSLNVAVSAGIVSCYFVSNI